MELETMRQFCLSLPAVTEDVKWDVHLAFCIGGKMFLIADLEEPFGYAFKADEEEFGELIQRNGIVPAPHLARAKWVKMANNALGAAELKDQVRKSYELIKAKLTKKLRAELGI